MHLGSFFSQLFAISFFSSQKGRKSKTLDKKREIICFMFRNNFFHRNTLGKSGGAPSLLQKEKRGSAKSDVPKVLFPDIGKITNLEFWLAKSITINSTLWWERFAWVNKEQRLIKWRKDFLGVRRQLLNNVNTGINFLTADNESKNGNLNTNA